MGLSAFKIYCFNIHKHTRSRLSVPLRARVAFHVWQKRGVSSLWGPSPIQGHCECSWERSIEYTHSHSIKRTHWQCLLWCLYDNVWAGVSAGVCETPPHTHIDVHTSTLFFLASQSHTSCVFKGNLPTSCKQLQTFKKIMKSFIRPKPPSGNQLVTVHNWF